MGEVYYVYLTMGIGTNWNKALNRSLQTQTSAPPLALQIEAIKGSQGSPGSLYNVNCWQLASIWHVFAD